MILPILSIIGSLFMIAGALWVYRVGFGRHTNRKENAEIDKEIKYFRGGK